MNRRFTAGTGRTNDRGALKGSPSILTVPSLRRRKFPEFLAYCYHKIYPGGGEGGTRTTDTRTHTDKNTD